MPRFLNVDACPMLSPLQDSTKYKVYVKPVMTLSKFPYGGLISNLALGSAKLTPSKVLFTVGIGLKLKELLE